MTRRDSLGTLVAAGAAGVVATVTGPVCAVDAGNGPAFPDGVKSGGPLPRGAVVWTRVARPLDGVPVPVIWSVAEDEAMQQVVCGGIAWAEDTDGRMVKLRVGHVDSDRWYHYGFDGPSGSMETLFTER
jgi:phosphodiesterase/alkaline phosphatase D-like protein